MALSQRGLRPGRRSEGASAGWRSRCSAESTGLSPRKGAVPVTISYRTTPSAWTSVAGETRAPVTCSGALSQGLPTMPVWGVQSDVSPGRNAAGQAEVGHHHPARAVRGTRQHDVATLKIPVHDSLAVGGRQRGHHLLDEGEGVRSTDRPLAHQGLTQGGSFQ